MAGSKAPLSKPRRPWADALKIWGPVVLVVLTGFAVAIYSLDEPPPRSLRIASGSPEGAYHAFAERYRELLANEGYELTVVPTAGSVENLELLGRGEVDLALVQGGTVGAEDRRAAQALASIFLEPVWVFHRAGQGGDHLTGLAGRRIALGTRGSGTRALALRLLEANGIGPAEATFVERGGSDAAAALRAGEVDVAIFVSSPEAGYLTELAGSEGIELMDFRREQAYRRLFPFLSLVSLGEGVLDLERDLPAEDKHLFAAAASLAARTDLHPGLIPLLLQTAERIHGSGGLFADPGTFPSERFVELPLDPDARQFLVHGPSFLHRILPFAVATQLDRMKILLLPLLTLLLPLVRAAPPIYRWRLRSKIYRWYEHLRRIDEALHRGDDDLDREELERILDGLESEVMAEVSVPLSYMDEYYRLRTHIDYVREKAERLGPDERSQSE